MPDYDFRTPRLFLDAPLEAGAERQASPAQANYLLNVLRLEASAGVLLFNGRDGEWGARLATAARKRVAFALEARTRPQPPPPTLRYLFAPLKHARLDYTVQKAVEMGAGVLQPVLTQHTQNGRINVERMRANAVEAAEQCGILHVPDCLPPVRLGDALDAFPAGRRLAFCDEREAQASPIEGLRGAAGTPVDVLVGPEGGFSAPEREMLRAKHFVIPISLGPRILRADTAAVAVLALVQASVGDWEPSAG